MRKITKALNAANRKLEKQAGRKNNKNRYFYDSKKNQIKIKKHK